MSANTRWDDGKIVLLIDEYQKNQLLWDVKHKDHYSRQLKVDTWRSIAKNLRLSVLEVKQKMNSLLGSFRREIRKGTGEDEKYVSNWYYFNRMQFLLDNRDTKYTKVHTNNKSESEDTDGDDLSYQEDETSIKLSPVSIEPSVSSEPPKKKKKIFHTDTDVEDAELIKTNPISTVPDTFSLYGQYIANKLRSYSSKTHIEVEHAINDILYRADKGCYDDQTNEFL